MRNLGAARSLFAKRLRTIRLRQGLSQERLAELSDLHRNYISILETGKQSATLDAIVKLAHALKVKPAVLLRDIQ